MTSLEFLNREQAEGAGLNFPDIYFSPAYAQASECMEGGMWQLAVFEGGKLLAPYLLRPLPNGLTTRKLYDLVSPYGYAGAFTAPGTELKDVIRFRDALKAYAAQRGIVAEFLRQGGLVPGRTLLFSADEAIESVHFNDTVLIDLRQGAEAYWSGCDGRNRTAVRKARKLGFRPTVRAAQSNDLITGDFRRLYDRTMERLGAGMNYRMSDAYYESLLAGMGASLLTCEVCDESGQVIAAALFMTFGPFMHYHLAGSDMTAAKSGANNLLIHSVIEWGCQNGFEALHLGGGTKPGDNLFKFKEGFGGRRIEFWIAKTILLPEEYRALTEARARQLSVSAEELLRRGFFPAYRI